MNKKEIMENAKNLVEKIREYSRSQKEYWQQIPLLALEADGRPEFKDNYKTAYKSGYWRLGNSSSFVDLESGEITNAISKPQTDQKVLEFALFIDYLDAEMEVDKLRKYSQNPISGYYSESEENFLRMKSESRKNLNLTKFYTRKNKEVEK